MPLKHVPAPVGRNCRTRLQVCSRLFLRQSTGVCPHWVSCLHSQWPLCAHPISCVWRLGDGEEGTLASLTAHLPEVIGSCFAEHRGRGQSDDSNVASSKRFSSFNWSTSVSAEDFPALDVVACSSAACPGSGVAIPHCLAIARCKSPASIGFATWSFMPASRNRARSSGAALAVTAMIGTSHALATLVRISRVASNTSGH